MLSLFDSNGFICAWLNFDELNIFSLDVKERNKRSYPQPSRRLVGAGDDRG